eukprot:4454294-Amphidinium_carterae.1
MDSPTIRRDGESSTMQPLICNFGEMVLADVKHVAVQKLAIRNQGQTVEGIWLGKTTHSGEHIIALKNNE